MNRKQKWALLVALLLAIVATFFARDDYGRLYILFTRQWTYNISTTLVCWGFILLALSLAVWALQEGPGQLTRLQRGIAWGGILILALTLLFMPSSDERHQFFYTYWRNSDDKILSIASLIALCETGLILGAIQIAPKSKYVIIQRVIYWCWVVFSLTCLQHPDLIREDLGYIAVIPTVAISAALMGVVISLIHLIERRDIHREG
ncbi:MAG: hypothetical protein ACYC7E_14275 [Armatimonadota bacterium]